MRHCINDSICLVRCRTRLLQICLTIPDLCQQEGSNDVLLCLFLLLWKAFQWLIVEIKEWQLTTSTMSICVMQQAESLRRQGSASYREQEPDRRTQEQQQLEFNEQKKRSEMQVRS